MGASVTMVARSRERGEKALKEVQTASASNNVRLMLCDLSSQVSIREFAAAFESENDRLDVLLNNAGSNYFKRHESVDGLELTFALNHMGYFVMTNLLLNIIKASAAGAHRQRLLGRASGRPYRLRRFTTGAGLWHECLCRD